MPTLTPEKKRYLWTGIILVLVLVGGVFLLRLTQPGLPSVANDFPRAKGAVNAPIQVIEYSDFQCSACQVTQAPLQEILNRRPGKIRLVFQHFPSDGHPWARLAHQAAECATRQNHFWNYHDRLYQGQPLWSKSLTPPLETFIGYAQEEGLDLDLFGSCLTDPKVDLTIQEEKSAGLGLGVRSTPTFFVNGKLAVGIQGLQAEIKKLEKS